MLAKIDGREVWRTTFELSNMRNNDVIVLHTPTRLSADWLVCAGKPRKEWGNVYRAYLKEQGGIEFKPTLSGSYPHWEMSRQVLQSELDAGLKLERCIKLEDEVRPEITRMLDGLTRMFINLTERSMHKDPVDALIHFIAYEYYDCMSSGANTYALSMARFLIEKKNIDLTKQVYPSSKGWDTVADFLEDIANVPRYEFEKMLPNEILSQL